ncbi:hypothetical protein [Listeria valentina]|uniref:hypothetical protein n=1 Tax=Listeria valentina TaxID=2705293 RepID=UPI00142F7DD7|nr:hypothetical protein [Listeria valentina]
MTDKKLKTTDAQREASKRYRDKHKEKVKIQGARRAGIYFIKNYATLEDLAELEKIIEEQKNFCKYLKTCYLSYKP